MCAPRGSSTGSNRPCASSHAARRCASRSSPRPAPTRHPELETAAYFVAAEGLTNAVKHAGAHSVRVSAERANGTLRVCVDDDGAGAGASSRSCRARRDRRGPGAAARRLARLFEDAGDEVAGQAGEARALLAAVAREQPDLAVVDVRMPPSFTDEGARAAAEIRERFPAVGVLVLSQHVETRYAAALVGDGGFGYLLKDRVLDVAEFLDAARRVAAGGSALDPKVVGARPDEHRRRAPPLPCRANRRVARAQRAHEARAACRTR